MDAVSNLVLRVHILYIGFLLFAFLLFGPDCTFLFSTLCLTCTPALPELCGTGTPVSGAPWGALMSALLQGAPPSIFFSVFQKRAEISHPLRVYSYLPCLCGLRPFCSYYLSGVSGCGGNK